MRAHIILQGNCIEALLATRLLSQRRLLCEASASQKSCSGFHTAQQQYLSVVWLYAADCDASSCGFGLLHMPGDVCSRQPWRSTSEGSVSRQTLTIFSRVCLFISAVALQSDNTRSGLQWCHMCAYENHGNVLQQKLLKALLSTTWQQQKNFKACHSNTETSTQQDNINHGEMGMVHEMEHAAAAT